MARAKKVVVEATPDPVVVEKAEEVAEKKVTCVNCDDSGLKCSVCGAVDPVV